MVPVGGPPPPPRPAGELKKRPNRAGAMPAATHVAVAAAAERGSTGGAAAAAAPHDRHVGASTGGWRGRWKKKPSLPRSSTSAAKGDGKASRRRTLASTWVGDGDRGGTSTGSLGSEPTGGAAAPAATPATGPPVAGGAPSACLSSVPRRTCRRMGASSAERATLRQPHSPPASDHVHQPRARRHRKSAQQLPVA